MPIARIDVVQMFDLDLSRKGRMPDPRTLLEPSESPAYKRYIDSFEWLFEPQTIGGNALSRSVDPTRRSLSREVNCPYSPPRYDRFALQSNPSDPGDRGGVITLSSSLLAGMVCIWKSYPDGGDAFAIKHSLSVDIPEFCLRQLAPIFEYISEGLLMYPFLSLRYASGDLAQVIREEGVFLGRLISGGLNHESDETMRSYVSQNVSRRNYEGLFLQSSKAIGVYTRGAEPNSDADLDLYEKTLFRAVQVCEMGLLEQRMLRTFKARSDDNAKKVRLLPRPLLVERRREELLVLEYEMMRSLPFRTQESIPLIRKAQEAFQIPSFLQEAKDSYNFLESRYQNTKTTALALLAVATYILDKLNVWAKVGKLLGIS
jgi:hypothetical protein